MPTSRLTSKGQTTIPLQVRERLGLRQGDAIVCVFQPDGSVTLRSPKRGVGSLKGLLHQPGRRAASLEEINAAVRHTAVSRHVRGAKSSAPVRRQRRRRT